MNKLLTIFTGVLLLTSTGWASSGPEMPEELAREARRAILTEVVPQEYSRDSARTIIMTEGYVDPKQFDKPEFADFHLAAYNWLKSFENNGKYDALTVLANEFQAKTGQGEQIGGAAREDRLAKKLGKFGLGGLAKAASELETGAGWPTALANYKERIDNCLQPNASICNVEGFTAKGTFKKFNIHVVNLAAAYINAVKPFVKKRMDELK